MSKFVTYPAVTVLDNDHSLLIDSPNAGTNSITANNAANTLLSKWSGFDTFDEAVQNTISNNQEFIDRDTAIRSETADLKRKIVTTFPAKDASGQIATFESEFEDAPLKSCIVQVEPVQEGSGDPSPDNVRPISGFTGVEVQRTGKNLLALPVIRFSEGTATVDNCFYLKQGTYTLSYSCTETHRFGVRMMDANGVIYTTSADAPMSGLSYNASAKCHYVGADIPSGSKTFTLTIKHDCYIRIVSNLTGGGFTDVQLELGSTATSYEPYNGTTIPITFPTEAGTVYGARIDVINGELVPQVELITLDGVVNKITGVFGTTNEGNTCLFSQNIGTRNQYEGSISNIFKFTKVSWNHMPLYSFFGGSGAASTIGFVFPPNTTVADANAWLAEQLANGTPVVVTRRIATPIHYPLTPTEIKTLLGVNNVWANTGDTSVEYLMSDVGWYVEKKLRAFQSILAGVEDSAVASKNYSTDSYLIFNDDIYRVTKTITAGETIEDGVNVTKTTVAEQLMALAQV